MPPQAPPPATTTKERILNATQDLLWDIGYEAMSPAKVMKKSGVGQGSLYHHFSGKEDLSYQAIKRTCDSMQATFDALFDDLSLSPLERVRHYLLKERNGLKGCRIGRLTHEPAFANPPLCEPAAHFFAHVLARIEDLLNQAQHNEELPPELAPQPLAATIVATIQGGYILSRATGNNKAITMAVDGFLQLLPQDEPSSKQDRP